MVESVRVSGCMWLSVRMSVWGVCVVESVCVVELVLVSVCVCLCLCG